MPLLGLGLLKINECSEKIWEEILKEVENILRECGYDFRSHPYGERRREYETIQYTKNLKTLEQAKDLELLTNEPKVGMELATILMSIEYIDAISAIPHKIKLVPYCWGWDGKWRESGMAAIDLLRDVFKKTPFKCIYYCSWENRDFITDAEREKSEEQDFAVALLNNPGLAGKLIAMADNLGK